MKRSSLIKLLALLIILGTLTTCSCSSAWQSPVYMTDIDDGSSMTYGNAISVSLQKKYYEASESIVFEIGIGTDLVFSELYGVSEDSYAYVTAYTSIIAVRDEEIFYSDTKHYDSFHTDERFLNARAVYGSPHVVSTKRPAYFEDFESYKAYAYDVMIHEQKDCYEAMLHSYSENEEAMQFVFEDNDLYNNVSWQTFQVGDNSVLILQAE